MMESNAHHASPSSIAQSSKKPGMTTSTAILLLTDSDDHRQQWRSTLASTNCRLVEDRAELAEVDVVVTDQGMIDQVRGPQGKRLADGEIGIVAVGSGGPADVSLPADYTPLELLVAVLLLAQIVRLRRKRREDKRVRQILSHLALSDPLTGLPNRRAWDDELTRRLANAGTKGLPFCLALIDLDHLKRINDEHGHAVGDDTLREFARALRESIRDVDFVARLGGDEFALLLAEVTADTAGDVVERVRRAVSERLEQAASPSATASAGFAVAADHEEADPLLRRADQALREAKAGGRNRTCPSGPSE